MYDTRTLTDLIKMKLLVYINILTLIIMANCQQAYHVPLSPNMALNLRRRDSIPLNVINQMPDQRRSMYRPEDSQNYRRTRNTDNGRRYDSNIYQVPVRRDSIPLSNLNQMSSAQRREMNRNDENYHNYRRTLDKVDDRYEEDITNAGDSYRRSYDFDSKVTHVKVNPSVNGNVDQKLAERDDFVVVLKYAPPAE